jgi:hypothetical protein
MQQFQEVLPGLFSETCYDTAHATSSVSASKVDAKTFDRFAVACTCKCAAADHTSPPRARRMETLTDPSDSVPMPPKRSCLESRDASSGDRTIGYAVPDQRLSGYGWGGRRFDLSGRLADPNI